MENSDTTPVYYCNSANIRMSVFDILLIFGKNFAEKKPDSEKIQVNFVEDFQVFMSPQHFKAGGEEKPYPLRCPPKIMMK